ncbi:DUF742 domain-containing protein [Streptomyces fractus]|uniref:DUF742 domain-containing protein n=1 Tax=Streptomyces fractus TaxID=641806 RepID=UPI003CF22220
MSGAGETVPGFEAGASSLVRAYTLTRGRTARTAHRKKLDLAAMVTVVDPRVEGGGGLDERTADELATEWSLGPEHHRIVQLCRRRAQSVAELSGVLDLPAGVVRVLLGDLVDDGIARITRPVRPAELPDEHILREVINGLRAL